MNLEGEKEIIDAMECKLINLKYEYVGYQGAEQWAIVSELSKSELMEKYPEQVAGYMPLVLLSMEQGEAINEYNRNDSDELLGRKRTSRAP